MYYVQIIYAIRLCSGCCDVYIYECESLRLASQVKSPYLVSFYGAYIQKKLTMVMEYCPRGTLYDVLKNPNEKISWERVLVFFTQTVQGCNL